MPSTRFETSAGWINGRHAELAAALQRALIEGILIPEHDRDIRILEYPAGSFLPPAGRGPCYSIVEIAMFSGRSIAAKARLYAALQRELGPFGINEGDLKVIIHDVPPHNWGLRGKPADLATIGFRVDV